MTLFWRRAAREQDNYLRWPYRDRDWGIRRTRIRFGLVAYGTYHVWPAFFCDVGDS